MLQRQRGACPPEGEEMVDTRRHDKPASTIARYRVGMGARTAQQRTGSFERRRVMPRPASQTWMMAKIGGRGGGTKAQHTSTETRRGRKAAARWAHAPVLHPSIAPSTYGGARLRRALGSVSALRRPTVALNGVALPPMHRPTLLATATPTIKASILRNSRPARPFLNLRHRHAQWPIATQGTRET